MSLQWVVMGFLVGVLMVPVSSQDVINCTWLTPSESSDCLKKADCSVESGYGIFIWEDCAVDTELFTLNSDTIHPEDCPYVTESAGQVILLSEVLDAEISGAKSCAFTGLSAKLFFTGVDINEFNPYPVSGTVSTMEVYVDENKDPGVIVEIYYGDADTGETTNLSSKLNSPEYNETFKLEPKSYASNIKTFEFSVLKELDFETQMFYKVEYDIISTDERANEKSTRHTFFVYVKDMPDNQPFWSKSVPLSPLQECREEADLFQVTAQDRDVEVNYNIKYSLQEESEYFKVDENSGMVSRIKEIDREALLEEGISSFSLAITATEYKPDGTIGEEPNSNEQVTTITVVDCNDQIPTFDQVAYEITTNELTKDSGNQDLDVKIVVTDMDEGDSGSFTLKTSDPQRLIVTPATGKQRQEVKLTAVFQDETNNYFNYEVHRDTPLIFTITATETTDPSHTTTATVTIHLTDVNDNAPEFTQPSYVQDLNETATIGTSILTVQASDADVHDNIGGPSIRYSLGSSCQELAINDVTGEVTLAMPLDFDDANTDNEIICTVNARDMIGTDLLGTSEVHISVLDVVDEPPQFKETATTMEITENSAPGTDVGSFTVTDADKGAAIAFNIEASACTKGAATAEDVKEWFAVGPDTPSHPNYPAKVTVGSVSPDREECSEVTLTINAVDQATEANANNDRGTVIITIQDTKEEPPIFKGEYNNLGPHPQSKYAGVSLIQMKRTPQVFHRNLESEVAPNQRRYRRKGAV